jgi:hypothetical protein
MGIMVEKCNSLRVEEKNNIFGLCCSENFVVNGVKKLFHKNKAKVSQMLHNKYIIN